jgi:hypothetical protein
MSKNITQFIFGMACAFSITIIDDYLVVGICFTIIYFLAFLYLQLGSKSDER